MQAKPWAIDVPIEVQGIEVEPVSARVPCMPPDSARSDSGKGDIVFADPIEGVVVIPQDKLDRVIELLPKLTAADDRVKEEVAGGMTVKDAFAKHR